MLATYRFVLATHVVLGSIALPAFWVAMAARKGSRLHLRAGATYGFTMSGTAALAVVLGVLTLVDPNGTHPIEPGWGPEDLAVHARVTQILIPSLGVFGLIALTQVFFGWRAPARVRPRGAAARAVDWAVPGALLAFGAAGITLGRLGGLRFADSMGVVCIVFALPQLTALARAGRTEVWIIEHLRGLGGAAVIGHVSLFVSVLPRLAPQLWTRDPFENAIPWVTPPLVGIALLEWGVRYWRHRERAFRKPGATAELVLR